MDALRQAMQADLIKAMKAEDRTTMMALRAALSAIANAEAAEQQEPAGPAEPSYDAPAAYGDQARRQLSPQQVKLVLLDEIEERRSTVGYYGQAGRHAEGQALQEEVEILEQYLYLT